MINKRDDKYVIDLDTINSMTEFPIKLLLPRKKDYAAQSKSDYLNFNYQEILVNDASSSISFSQYDNKMMLTIIGPKECRHKDKAKNDTCIVDVYTKHNNEVSKESKN